jgi:hypothetical protein
MEGLYPEYTEPLKLKLIAITLKEIGLERTFFYSAIERSCSPYLNIY